MARIGRFLRGVAALLLYFSPFLVIIFAATLIASILGGVWPYHSVILHGYWVAAWKIYVGLAVFTCAVLATFSYQGCCVGSGSFLRHVKHSFKSFLLNEVSGAILWPIAWFNIDHNMRSWGMSWGDIVLNALRHWFSTSWRGVDLVVVNFHTGKVTEYHVKSSEEACAVVDTELNQMV